jgi:hypothetical protein
MVVHEERVDETLGYCTPVGPLPPSYIVDSSFVPCICNTLTGEEAWQSPEFWNVAAPMTAIAAILSE